MSLRAKSAAGSAASKAAPIERFAAIVGDKYALREPAEIAPFLHEPRELYQGRAALVLKPGSTEEVSEILKLAQETKTAIVPQGGNTGLVGGQISFDSQAVVVSTVRLDKIREIDPATNSMTCEAGVVLARAQESATKLDRLFPLSLGAEGSCTIGGNLATNAGGTQALSYGVARDLVLGLEVVLAGGRVWHGLRKLKKDNTGYDLRHLFIGSEGTLGIITAAALKLFPAPRATETAFVGVAENALLIVSALVVVAGLLGMLNALLTTLNERRREMAILRALGARPHIVFGMLLLEASLLMLLGIALGLILLYAGLAAASSYVEAHYGLHFAISLPSMREIVLLGMVCAGGVLAGCLPAWLAYRRALGDGLSMRT